METQSQTTGQGWLENHQRRAILLGLILYSENHLNKTH